MNEQTGEIVENKQDRQRTAMGFGQTEETKLKKNCCDMSPFTILVLLSIFYVLAGACNAGFTKYIVSQKSFGLKFSHGWFLNLVMFIGESMGIPVYYLLFHKKQKSEEESKEEEEKKPEINKFLLAIPGFLDTCSTGLANIGLILLPASIYQMLKGSLIVLTFLMSKFVVRNKHTLDHYVAVPVSTIGVVLVGYSAYLNADENEHTSTASQTLLGITLMVIAMFILSIQFCFDEYFMRRYTCHPLICIGYQGVFGFFINLCLCIIFYFIKCGSYNTREEVPYFVENMCTEDDNKEWRPENIVFALRQLIDNHILTIIVPITIIFMSSFNIFGVSITKYGSATTRSVTDNCRSFLVWLFFLMPFNQEDLIEKFNWVQLIGFICICLGAFMYNGMLKLEERRTRKTKKINLDDPEKKENEDEDEKENRKLLDSQRLSESNDDA
jgi:drug/metabolite transporter (DMT)-like permease